MLHQLVLRDCQAKPSKTTLMPSQIDIYHPGYDDEVVWPISFPGNDSKEEDLWYDSAHTACAIILKNQFDGWLSTNPITAFLRGVTGGTCLEVI